DDAAGFAYRSDTRGSYPYLPAAAGQVFRAPEIPTTLPTLDEVYGRTARRPAELADYYVGLLRPDALNVHTIHAELEGGPYVGVLDTLLARLRRRACFVRLCDEAASLCPATVAAGLGVLVTMALARAVGASAGIAGLILATAPEY